MRIKRKGDLEFFVGRRYGDFHRLHKRLRTELPGKVLPPMPRKNKQDSTATNLIYGLTGRVDDDDASSISSMSTMPPVPQLQTPMNNLTIKGGPQCYNCQKPVLIQSLDHRRNASTTAASFGRSSPRPSIETRRSMDGRFPPTPENEVRFFHSSNRKSC